MNNPITDFRLQNDLSQEAMGKLLGYTRTNVGKNEKRYPNISAKFKLRFDSLISNFQGVKTVTAFDIQNFRATKLVTQKQLATLLKYTNATLSRLETGKQLPSPRFSKAFLELQAKIDPVQTVVPISENENVASSQSSISEFSIEEIKQNIIKQLKAKSVEIMITF